MTRQDADQVQAAVVKAPTEERRLREAATDVVVSFRQWQEAHGTLQEDDTLAAIDRLEQLLGLNRKAGR